MISEVSRIWSCAPRLTVYHERCAVLVVSCAVIDAVAAAVPLLGDRLPGVSVGLVAGVLHAIAALLLSFLPGTLSSRRWLCVAAVLVVPGAGVGVAAAVLGTKGQDPVERRERRRRTLGRPASGVAEAQPLGGDLSPCDALECSDGEMRRSALWALAKRSDPEAIALLRWAAAGRDPDLALSAALALDQIAERAEAGTVGRVCTAEGDHAAA